MENSLLILGEDIEPDSYSDHFGLVLHTPTLTGFHYHILYTLMGDRQSPAVISLSQFRKKHQYQRYSAAYTLSRKKHHRRGEKIIREGCF